MLNDFSKTRNNIKNVVIISILTIRNQTHVLIENWTVISGYVFWYYEK